jgi:plastocyanin domain-containing protein
MRTFLVLVLMLLNACKKDEVKTDVPAPTVAPVVAGPRAIEMKVDQSGFQPANVTVKKDQPVKLRVTRVTDETCATELLIDGTDIKAALPLNTPVEIAWTPTSAGEVKFGCAMDKMVGGVLLVE